MLPWWITIAWLPLNNWGGRCPRTGDRAVKRPKMSCPLGGRAFFSRVLFCVIMLSLNPSDIVVTEC